MKEESNDKQYFERFYGKFIYVSKKVGTQTLSFKGKCIEVLDDKLIIDDIHAGLLPLSYDYLSVTGVSEGPKQNEY